MVKNIRQTGRRGPYRRPSKVWLRRFADRLRAVQKAQKMTQDQFAEFVGVNRVTVTSWLGGMRQPGAHDLEIVGAKTNTSTDWLLTGLDADKNPTSEPQPRNRQLDKPKLERELTLAVWDFVRKQGIEIPENSVWIDPARLLTTIAELARSELPAWIRYFENVDTLVNAAHELGELARRGNKDSDLKPRLEEAALELFEMESRLRPVPGLLDGATWERFPHHAPGRSTIPGFAIGGRP